MRLRGQQGVHNELHDEKINYTNFLNGKPQETDPEKLARMKAAMVKALKERGVHGHVSAVYYTDGRVKVSVNGKYYNVFDTNAGKFFRACWGLRRGKNEEICLRRVF